MTEVRRFGSGGAWEEGVGYSRVVRAGPHVWVAGCTAATPEGGVIGGSDAHAQALAAWEAVERALGSAGAALADVVQTRMYVTEIGQWEEVGRAHRDVFGDIKPATAMVEVSALIDPRLLVEVEAQAYVAES